MITPKCDGVPRRVEGCPNDARWAETGYSVSRGVPSRSSVCDQCKAEMLRTYRPTILAWNLHPIKFTRITGNTQIDRWL